MKVEEPGDHKVQQYESIVELANKTKGPLDAKSIEKIEELIEELDNDEDPIFKVNCLQLIADLACSKQALAILEQHKVPEKLISLLEDSDPLIAPHAMKFFYRINPVDIEAKYPQALDKIVSYCQSENMQLLDYAIDIIAAIGRGGYHARQVLDRHPRFKSDCLSKMGATIVSSDPLIKSRTLKCIIDLLEIHEDDPVQESIELSERFYHSILDGELRMTNHLLILCRVPFMEIRVNALYAVATVAPQIWAQKELASHPNFLKWILDRSTEATKDGKEAKFEILKAIVKSETASRIFNVDDYMKMRADFKNGPFHVGIAEEMLMDDTPAS